MSYTWKVIFLRYEQFGHDIRHTSKIISMFVDFLTSLYAKKERQLVRDGVRSTRIC